MSASRWPWSSRRAAIWPRTPRRTIVVDYEPLPVVIDLEAALQPGSTCIHDDLGSNVAAHVRQTKGSYAEAQMRADRIVRRRFSYDRGASSPIETRGVVAQWDAKSERLTIWDTTQAPVVDPQRPRGDARTERATGARDRAVHRRRLRAEDHDVLSGGGADPLGRDAAQPADQVDRGPPRALRRHDARARPDPRCRDRRSAGTAGSSASGTSSCTTPAPTIPTGSRSRSTASARCSVPTSCRATTAHSPRSSPTSRS